MNLLKKFWNEEDGQDLIEYALLAALIAVGAVTSMEALSGSINSTFSTVQGKLDSAS
jgi:pilus assembly protein Flp/PilA